VRRVWDPEDPDWHTENYCLSLGSENLIFLIRMKARTPFTAPAAALDPAPMTPSPPPAVAIPSPALDLTQGGLMPGLTQGLTPRRSALETGQGPFKPSHSWRRALFGIEKAIRDLQLYVGRIDPEASSDESTSDRALLAGIELVIRGAKQMEDSAKVSLGRLKGPKAGSGGSTVGGTPVHKDPRNGMREQLMRCQREAHEAALALETCARPPHCPTARPQPARLKASPRPLTRRRRHQRTLHERVDSIYQCINIMQMMQVIYGQEGEAKSLSMTTPGRTTLGSPGRTRPSSPARSRPSSPRGASSPRVPAVTVAGGKSAASSVGLRVPPWSEVTAHTPQPHESLRMQ
jgi:hypothetical protein